MELIWTHLVEILLTTIALTVGGLGAFQMHHNKKIDQHKTEQDNKLQEQRDRMEDRHLRMLERMETNQNEFRRLHTQSIQRMNDLTATITATNVEIHNTNDRLKDLTDTVTFVMRDQIPHIQSQITDLRDEVTKVKIKQEHCPIIKSGGHEH